MISRLSTTRIVLLCIAGFALGFVCWFFGVDPWYAAGFALVFVALGIAWGSLGGADIPEWGQPAADEVTGGRDDVVRLAWSMRMHRGQVHEPAYKRLREIARTRLEPRRLDIDRPADREAIEALIGTWAYRSLHAPDGKLPSLAALENALTALDSLTGDASPPRPTAMPEQMRDALTGILNIRPIAELLGRKRQPHAR